MELFLNHLQFHGLFLKVIKSFNSDYSFAKKILKDLTITLTNVTQPLSKKLLWLIVGKKSGFIDYIERIKE